MPRSKCFRYNSSFSAKFFCDRSVATLNTPTQSFRRHAQNPSIASQPYHGLGGIRPPQIMGCNVTKFPQYKALKSMSITRGRLTFDERCVVLRVNDTCLTLLSNASVPGNANLDRSRGRQRFQGFGTPSRPPLKPRKVHIFEVGWVDL